MPRGMIPGGFGRPIPGTRGNMPGMGMYANAGNTPPAPVPNGTPQSPWTSMTAGSPGGPPPMQMGMGQRPQMMANALMQQPPMPGSIGAQLASGQPMPQTTMFGGVPGQAAPQQPAMRAAPMQPPRGYTR